MDKQVTPNTRPAGERTSGAEPAPGDKALAQPTLARCR